MRHFAKLVMLSGLLTLGACWTEGDDKAAEQVEQSFDNTAEAYEKAADNASGAQEEQLEDVAEVYRETGEEAADAVDDADLQTNQAAAQ